jgi:hypothetical protein
MLNLPELTTPEKVAVLQVLDDNKNSEFSGPLLFVDAIKSLKARLGCCLIDAMRIVHAYAVEQSPRNQAQAEWMAVTKLDFARLMLLDACSSFTESSIKSRLEYLFDEIRAEFLAQVEREHITYVS